MGHFVTPTPDNVNLITEKGQMLETSAFQSPYSAVNWYFYGAPDHY